MEKNEREALLSVLNCIEGSIFVERQSTFSELDFMYSELFYALKNVLAVCRDTQESGKVSDLLNEIAEYYYSSNKRDALDDGELDDSADIEWFLNTRDLIIAQIEIGQELKAEQRRNKPLNRD